MGKIASLIALVKRNVETLDELVRKYGAAEVVEDYVLLNASLHLMQVAIQALIDAAVHLLVELGASCRADIQTCPLPWLSTAS